MDHFSGSLGSGQNATTPIATAITKPAEMIHRLLFTSLSSSAHAICRNLRRDPSQHIRRLCPHTCIRILQRSSRDHGRPFKTCSPRVKFCCMHREIFQSVDNTPSEPRVRTRGAVIYILVLLRKRYRICCKSLQHVARHEISTTPDKERYCRAHIRTKVCGARNGMAFVPILFTATVVSDGFL